MNLQPSESPGGCAGREVRVDEPREGVEALALDAPTSSAAGPATEVAQNEAAAAELATVVLEPAPLGAVDSPRPATEVAWNEAAASTSDAAELATVAPSRPYSARSIRAAGTRVGADRPAHPFPSRRRSTSRCPARASKPHRRRSAPRRRRRRRA